MIRNKLLTREKVKNIFVNILLVVISILIVLVIVELTLPFLKIRVLEESVYGVRRPVIIGTHSVYHPRLGFTLQKNLRNVRQVYPGQLDYTVDTNAHGFRGPDWDLSPHRKNVILLGDSFAFGWGVQWDQTVGQMLEKYLQKKDPSYQVINLAMGAWDIDIIITCFELYKDVLKPVAVVYVFCPNDLLGAVKRVSDKEYDLELHPPPDAEKKFQEMVARQQESYWSWDKFRRRTYLKAFHACMIRPIFSRRIKDSRRIDRAPAGFDFPPPIPPPAESTFDPERKKFFLYCLQRLRTDAGNADVYIIDTSDKSILYQKDAPDNRRWVIHQFSQTNPGVHFIDFESYIRKTPDGRKFFLDYDDHWSAAGHAAAAGQLIKSWSSVQN